MTHDLITGREGGAAGTGGEQPQYGLSRTFFGCTFRRLFSTWKPFMVRMAACAESTLSNDTKPKHLLRLEVLSMNTLAERIWPKGANNPIRSASPYSTARGRGHTRRIKGEKD